MRHSTLIALILAALTLGACAPAAQDTTLPTIDPRLLTVTMPSTITPEATYTPYPTLARSPSSTPFPTFVPVVTLIPYTLAPTATPTVRSARQSTRTPMPSATSPIGVSGVGPDRAELSPILTFEPISYCHQWMLAQIGIINRGTKAATNFDVVWTFGWNEPRTEHVDVLQWYAGPLWFFSGQTAVQCDSTTTPKAWIRIDPEGAVPGDDKSDNYKEQIYTVILPSPTPSPEP